MDDLPMPEDLALTLMSIIATHLAGVDCEVRKVSGQRRPYNGRCYRSGDGAIIELTDHIPRDRTLFIYLHEVAHAKYDLPNYKDWRRRGWPAQRRFDNSWLKHPRRMLVEERADLLAHFWLDICDLAGPGKTVLERLDYLIARWPALMDTVGTSSA